MSALDCPMTCPLVQARQSSLDFGAGQLRRLAPADGDEVDETKRNVLKLLAVAGVLGAGVGGLAGGSLQFLQPPQVGLSSYPTVQLIDVDGTPLTTAKADAEYNADTAELFIFYYPLRNEPNFFLNLQPATPGGPGATNVPGGVGPNGSIVAFSAICQHLGCPAPAIAYYPAGICPNTPGGKTFYIHCSCHGSTYDPANRAANLTGPAVLPLPQVILETDASGNIYATGITSSSPPVNGHISTLVGDYGVGSTSQLTSESPVHLCNFPV